MEKEIQLPELSAEAKDMLQKQTHIFVTAYKFSTITTSQTTSQQEMDFSAQVRQMTDFDTWETLKPYNKEIFLYLLALYKKKVASKLPRDAKKAFQRQLEQLEEIREKSLQKGDLKTSLEAIKETNKLVSLYDKEYFKAKESKVDLSNIKAKVLKELEDELGDLI